MSVPDYSYVGSGRIYMRDNSVAAQPFLEVGNCSALAFSINEDIKELKDYTVPGGGTRNEVRRIASVECSLTIHDLIAQNLARATNATVTAVAGAQARVNQAMGTAARGTTLRGFAPFPEIGALSPAPVVRQTNGRTAAVRANSTVYALNAYITPAAPNLFFYRFSVAGTSASSPPVFPTTLGGTVADGSGTIICVGRIILLTSTDYEIRSTGVLIASAAFYTDGEPLEADYTTVAQDLVQSLVQTAREFEMYFDGLNEARSGKRVAVRAFRVRIGAAQNISLIGEDFAALEVGGKLLADTAKGAGLSQFFTVALEV